MAMNNVQQNVASELQAIALELLSLQQRMGPVVKMFATESLGDLLDADYAELPEFAHITSGEAVTAKNSIDAIDGTIGAYDVGTHATKILKICNVVPK